MHLIHMKKKIKVQNDYDDQSGLIYWAKLSSTIEEERKFFHNINSLFKIVSKNLSLKKMEEAIFWSETIIINTQKSTENTSNSMQNQ